MHDNLGNGDGSTRIEAHELRESAKGRVGNPVALFHFAHSLPTPLDTPHGLEAGVKGGLHTRCVNSVGVVDCTPKDTFARGQRHERERTGERETVSDWPSALGYMYVCIHMHPRVGLCVCVMHRRRH